MKHNTEILYGIHPVSEALKAGRRTFHELYIIKGKTPARFVNAIENAQSQKIPLKKITSARLAEISDSEYHQGIGAKVSSYPLIDFFDIADKIKSNGKGFLLILDNVKDPHNLGAMVRTALCTGVNGVIIPKDRAVSPTPAVSKASAGAIEHAFISRVTNVVDTINRLKDKGFWIMGLDMSAGKSIYDTNYTGPIAIVIGGEEKGIRPLVKTNCDFLSFIPQAGQINSLNASVAGAVAMYEVFRQRNK